MARSEPPKTYQHTALPRALNVAVKNKFANSWGHLDTAKALFVNEKLGNYNVSFDEGKLCDQVFGVNPIVMRKEHPQCGPTPYGLPSINVLFAGKLLVAILPVEHLDGANYSAKRLALSKMRGSSMMEFFAAHPTVCDMFLATAGTVYYVPPGSLVLTHCMEDTRMCQWAFGGEAQVLRQALMTSSDLLSTFDSLSQTNYKSWIDLLMKVLA